MKAVTLDGFDTPPRRRDDLPAPTPAAHGVLVRVHASSINPSDNSIAAGMLKQMGVEYEFPVTLGRDYAGVVEQVGSDVSRYRVGDAVFGFLLHANPIAHDGSWAELIAVPQDMFIGRAPEGVDDAIAGAAPACSQTEHCACTSSTRTRWRRRPPRSLRWGLLILRGSSPSASSDSQTVCWPPES